MPLFKDMLKSEESLFRDEIALDYDFLPKNLPYRDKEQKYIAQCIFPLTQKRNGKNLLVHGLPGIGKTAAAKYVIRDLENETEEVIPLYVNCWKKNSTFKIITDFCDQLGFKFVQNKTKEELFDMIVKELNKKSAVFVLDEVDKLEDYDILYLLLEDVYRKTIIMITNYRKWVLELDERIRSRMNPEMMEFKAYNSEETKGILKHRLGYAFVPGVWEDDAFEIAAAKTAELNDIRQGLYILKEAGLAAEAESSRKINTEHVKKALAKIEDYHLKQPTDLEDEAKQILDIIKDNNSKKIGDIFNLYVASGGNISYKSFQRRINILEKEKFITVIKTQGGEEGNTSIIKLSQTKKLTEF
jgi:cell division control protein 6